MLSNFHGPVKNHEHFWFWQSRSVKSLYKSRYALICYHCNALNGFRDRSKFTGYIGSDLVKICLKKSPPPVVEKRLRPRLFFAKKNSQPPFLISCQNSLYRVTKTEGQITYRFNVRDFSSFKEISAKGVRYFWFLIGISRVEFLMSDLPLDENHFMFFIVCIMLQWTHPSHLTQPNLIWPHKRLFLENRHSDSRNLIFEKKLFGPLFFSKKYLRPLIYYQKSLHSLSMVLALW